MSLDLSSLSVPQLEALAIQVADAIQSKKAQAKKLLIADMQRIAREAGVSLSDLFGEATSKAKVAKPAAAPKYRNPNDPSQTWSGRGRQPLWLAEFIASGRDIADLKCDTVNS